jgi:hypothetical protein
MKAAVIAIIVALAMIIFILAENTQVENKTITKHDTLRLRYTRTDTIYKIRQRYGYITDSVTRWVYDSTWDNLCRSFTDSAGKEGCQREVVRQLLSGQLNAALVNEYQNKWAQDSLWIQEALKLDSIKTDRISNLIKKNEQLSTKKQRTKRLAKIGHFAAGLVGAIMIIK